MSPEREKTDSKQNEAVNEGSVLDDDKASHPGASSWTAANSDLSESPIHLRFGVFLLILVFAVFREAKFILVSFFSVACNFVAEYLWHLLHARLCPVKYQEPLDYWVARVFRDSQTLTNARQLSGEYIADSQTFAERWNFEAFWELSTNCVQRQLSEQELNKNGEPVAVGPRTPLKVYLRNFAKNVRVAVWPIMKARFRQNARFLSRIFWEHHCAVCLGEDFPKESPFRVVHCLATGRDVISNYHTHRAWWQYEDYKYSWYWNGWDSASSSAQKEEETGSQQRSSAATDNNKSGRSGSCSSGNDGVNTQEHNNGQDAVTKDSSVETKEGPKDDYRQWYVDTNNADRDLPSHDAIRKNAKELKSELKFVLINARHELNGHWPETLLFQPREFQKRLDWASSGWGQSNCELVKSVAGSHAALYFTESGLREIGGMVAARMKPQLPSAEATLAEHRRAQPLATSAGDHRIRSHVSTSSSSTSKRPLEEENSARRLGPSGDTAREQAGPSREIREQTFLPSKKKGVPTTMSPGEADARCLRDVAVWAEKVRLPEHIAALSAVTNNDGSNGSKGDGAKDLNMRNGFGAGNCSPGTQRTEERRNKNPFRVDFDGWL